MLIADSDPRNRNRKTSQKGSRPAPAGPAGGRHKGGPAGSVDIHCKGQHGSTRNVVRGGPGPCKEGLSPRERHQKLALLKENLADPLQGAEWSNPTLGRWPDSATFPALPALMSCHVC